MLALETGWHPDVLAELPVAFRAACHWTLFARAIVGPDGLPTFDTPPGAPMKARLAAGKGRVMVAKVRAALFPEDADE